MSRSFIDPPCERCTLRIRSLETALKDVRPDHMKSEAISLTGIVNPPARKFFSDFILLI